MSEHIKDHYRKMKDRVSRASSTLLNEGQNEESLREFDTAVESLVAFEENNRPVLLMLKLM